MHGPEGTAWLGRLPKIVAECSRKWSLDVDPPFPDVFYNYVAPGVRADGSAVVLKVCYPDEEFVTEAEALRLFDGRGAVRLLAVDVDLGALLLERLAPGTSLHAVVDDRQAIGIAVGVMRRLWRPAPTVHPFPPYADWLTRMAEKAPRLIGPSSPFPAAWIDRALALYSELAARSSEPVLLHGDLHHGNILAAEREPWLAIDPKGIVGEPECEVETLLLNALSPSLGAERIRQTFNRQVAQAAEELGFDRERLRARAIVRSVLSAFWTLEDHGHGWEPAINLAEALAATKV